MTNGRGRASTLGLKVTGAATFRSTQGVSDALAYPPRANQQTDNPKHSVPSTQADAFPPMGPAVSKTGNPLNEEISH